MLFNAAVIRRQFPILKKVISGHPLVYLDNAATTQKPVAVLDALLSFYSDKNGNINRGFHPLAEAATTSYDQARNRIAGFINASSPNEIIFTKNTTEAINLVAKTWGETLRSGDGILLTVMEHHSNIVPWFQLQEKKGIEIKWVPVTPDGELDLKSLEKNLSSGKIRLVSITGLSNVLGYLPPLKKIAGLAHGSGAKILVDAAQLAGHEPIDVRQMDADFLAFSGHKIYGPTGTGVLYAKAAILEKMPPFLGGGDMIRSVTTEGFLAAELPRKFEAGTPAIADVIGLAEALSWLEKIGKDEAFEYMRNLTRYAEDKLSEIPRLKILGPRHPKKRSGNVSFIIEGVHPHDLTEILGRKGICLRAGHHCTQPLHEFLGIKASTRLSVGVYNTKEEIDICVKAIADAKKILKK